MAATAAAALRRGTMVLSLAWVAGCGSVPFEDPTGGIPPGTELALSPDGRWLLAGWRDQGKTQGRLLELAPDGSVAGMRDVPLPASLFTLAWGRGEGHALLTTRHRGGSELIRVDLPGGAATTLYSSRSVLRFPLEIDTGEFVVLEERQPGKYYSRWQRLKDGRKTLLSDAVYGLAAPLEHIQGSLHLLEPTLRYRSFQGTLPPGLQELVDRSTWTLHCADRQPYACVRTRAYVPSAESSYSTIELFDGSRRCSIRGRWRDLREDQISLDGSTLVFHAALDHRDGPRALYIVRNDGRCAPTQVLLQDWRAPAGRPSALRKPR